jgi:hypothetical protein
MPHGERPAVRATLASSVLAALAALPTSARADAEEWLVLVEPTLDVYQGAVDGQATTAVGGGGAVAGWLGLTTSAWLFVSAGGTVHSQGAPVVGEAVGGFALALDVLRAIPFLEVGLGATWVRDEPLPVLRLGLGLDFLVSPHTFVGLAARYRPVFGAGGEDLWSIALRVGWRDEL